MALSKIVASVTVLASAGLFTPAAWSHHGWSWADADPIRLEGTVQKVQIAPPHPWMDVETADGTWRVELGNPSQTRTAGFVEGSAQPGDAIIATGNRAQNHAEKRMKAVQVTVRGKTYDIYPERIKKPGS